MRCPERRHFACNMIVLYDGIRILACLGFAIKRATEFAGRAAETPQPKRVATRDTQHTMEQ